MTIAVSVAKETGLVRTIRASVFSKLGVPSPDGALDSTQLLAEYDHTACGTVRLTSERTADGGHGVLLEALAVLPEARGRGVGRALMLRGIDLARANCARYLRLDARAETVGFYESLGFIPVGDPFMWMGHPHQPMCLMLEDST